MSTSTDAGLDGLIASLDKDFNPNETHDPTGKKQNTATVQNGQITPESTPDPDLARNEADKRRQATGKGRVQKQNTATVQNGQITPENTPGPDQARNEADKAQSTSRKRKTPASASEPQPKFNDNGGEIRKERENKRLEAKQKAAIDYVLKVPDDDFYGILAIGEDDDRSRENIEVRYKETAKLVNPDNNKDPRAKQASEKVEAAVTYLRARIRPMPPGKDVKDVQKELLDSVLNAPDDQPYQILQLRSGQENMAKGRAGALANAFNPENNKDPRAKEAFDKVNRAVEKLGLGVQAGESFADDVDMEDAQSEEGSGEGSGEESGGENTSSTPTRRPDTTTREPGTTTREPDTTTKEPDTTTRKPYTPTRRPATALNYPWATGRTKDGDPIITVRENTRRGQIESYTCIVETWGEVPYEYKSGWEVGRDELEQYLKQNGIKKFAEKDSEGRKKKIWTYRDGPHFRKLHWVATAPLKTGTYGGRHRDPESTCCAEWSWGWEILSRSEFASAMGKKNAEARIQSYCEEENTTPPWEVKPAVVRVAREDFERLTRTPSPERRRTSSPERRRTPSPEQNSEFTSRLAAVESALKPGGRIAFIEEKVLKIDDLASSMKELVSKMSMLAVEMSKLQQK